MNAKRRIKLRRDPSLDKGHRSKCVIIISEKFIFRLILKEGDSFSTVLKILRAFNVRADDILFSFLERKLEKLFGIARRACG